MNSKKNSFKRVAAGALAVLTVAAYTTPVANVGGLLNTSLVANADEVLTYKAFKCNTDNIYQAITSVSDTVNTYTASQLAASTGYTVNLAQGKTVVVKSSVPLEFIKKGDGEVTSGTTTWRHDGETVYKIAEGASAATLNGSPVIVKATDSEAALKAAAPKTGVTIANYVESEGYYYAKVDEPFTGNELIKVDEKYYEESPKSGLNTTEGFFTSAGAPITNGFTEEDGKYNYTGTEDKIYREYDGDLDNYVNTEGNTYKELKSTVKKIGNDYVAKSATPVTELYEIEANAGYCIKQDNTYVTKIDGNTVPTEVYSYVADIADSYDNGTYFAANDNYKYVNGNYYEKNVNIKVGEADKLTENSANNVFTYTFTMPVSDVTVVGKKSSIVIGNTNIIYRNGQDTTLDATAFDKVVSIDGNALGTGLVKSGDVDPDGDLDPDFSYYDLLTNKQVKFSATDPFKLVTWSGVTGESTSTIKSTYVDGIYIAPVSDQYAKQIPDFTAGAGFTGTKTSGQAHLAFAAKNAPTGATLKQIGVVVDKTGSLYTYNEDTKKNNLKPEANAKLLLGKSYTEGKKTDFTKDKNYGANVTPKAGKFIVARPYEIYTINGVDVTIYGDVVIIDKAQADWGLV